jgi:cobalt/nickel transport system permease protein
MLLPAWMTEKSNLYETTDTVVKSGKSKYLTKSIRNMRAVICEDMQTEQFAKQNGLLQKMTPGLKLIVMLILILGASMSRQIPVLLALWMATLLLMKLSCLPVLALQKRIWGSIPLLTLLFSLPITLNIFLDGTPILIIHQSVQASRWLGIIWPASLFITKQGVTVASLLFLRVGISLSLGVMLVTTTPVADIFKSLRVIKVPEFFIMIIEMTYRYLLVLLSISIEMFEARSLRIVGNMPASWQRAQVGSSIAALFARSMALSEEVYQAMCARCYTGENLALLLDECPQLELIEKI